MRSIHLRRALLGVILGLWLAACEDPPLPALPPPEPTPAEKIEPEVVSTTGRVERQLAADEWVPVKVGERLASDSSIRTGPDARADLALGRDATVTVQPESQVGVIEITEAVGRLELRRGRLSVTQETEGGRVLRIEGEGGQVVEARGARFVVRKSDRDFAVATVTGSVDLASAGETVTVKAGTQAVANRGETPSAATPIPPELLLRVARAASRNKDLCAVIEGQASVGAEVRVAGEPAVVDNDGRFRVEVPRAPMRNTVEVVTTDIQGHERTEQVPCQALPPPSRSEPEPAPDSKIEDLSIQWGEGAPGTE